MVQYSVQPCRFRKLVEFKWVIVIGEGNLHRMCMIVIMKRNSLKVRVEKFTYLYFHNCSFFLIYIVYQKGYIYPKGVKTTLRIESLRIVSAHNNLLKKNYK